MSESPTFKEVARLAGVSLATVSRCVNAPEKVSEETRDKVSAAMRQLDYRYNSLARSFATRTTRTLGVVVPTITNPVFAESTRGIQDVANARGHQLILANTDYQPATETSVIRNLRQHQVDGIILTSSDRDGETVRELAEDSFPTVQLYSTITEGPMSAVGVDNVEGGRMAAAHLYAMGHRRVAMLAGAMALSDRSRDRCLGFSACLEELGAYDPALIVETGFGLEDCRTTVARVMAQSPRPTALFCSNDLLAVGAMAGLRELGWSVPHDVSVMGFDDAPLAAFVSPGLTTVRQPAYDMGRKGAEVLFELLSGAQEHPTYTLLDLEIIIRESVAALGV